MRKRPEKLGADLCSHKDLSTTAVVAVLVATMTKHWKVWHSDLVHGGYLNSNGSDWDIFDDCDS